MDIKLGLTFDDVLLVPQYSSIKSRGDVSLKTKISKNIPLNIPLISSNMDTVTEDKMAISMARHGGIGIIHRYCSIEEQTNMVNKVKRAESYIIYDPYTASKNDTIGSLKEKINKTGINSYLIVDNENKLEGIITSRDLKFMNNENLINQCMTPINKMKIIFTSQQISMDEAKKIMYDNRIQKLPIVDDNYKLESLICLKDIERIQQRPMANLDINGKLRCGAAIGIKEESIDRANKLIKAGADVLVIDIAHGFSESCINTLRLLKENFEDIDVVVGNVVTSDAALELIKNGADGIKIGIGNGCLKNGTRILMSSGIYKNIENVKIGDYVINANGDPVKVIDVFMTGIKKVIKIRTNCFYKDIYVTPDHKFWIGDLSMIKNLAAGIAKNLDALTLTTPKTSKYKFKEIGDFDLNKNFSLTPNEIKWKLPETFNVDLAEYISDSKHIKILDKTIKCKSSNINRYIVPSYELGYLFGSYLGDGTIGEMSIYWSYGLNKIEICKKTIKYIKIVFNYDSVYVQNKFRDYNTIHIYNKCISSFFEQFGKKQNKHLSEIYYCLNKEYIQGILDGLIDSDGLIREKKKEKHNDRYCFHNTNPELIELFNWCCLTLKKGYSNLKSEITTGYLKNCNIENCKQGYDAYILNENRFTKNYIYSWILEKEETDLEVPVFDITVDCPTHTFIANGIIVHNSICTTRLVSGSGMPQFTALMDTAPICKEYNIPLISDGGNRNYGNICKALAIGADSVMLGRMIAGTDESPGKILIKEGKRVKIIRGMAGYGANVSNAIRQGIKEPDSLSFSAEGVEGYVPYSGPVSETLKQICAGISSGMSYSGANNINELQKKAKFIRLTNNGVIESGVHDIIHM